MRALNLRLGWAELFVLASLPIVAGFLTPAFIGGWTVALVPGLTYLLAVGMLYTLYRLYLAERAQVSVAAAAGVTFRVVDARGVCPLGRRKGDLVTVEVGGPVTPALCPHAELVLRRAAIIGEEQPVQQWCCPVYEHLLVFERELKAA